MGTEGGRAKTGVGGDTVGPGAGSSAAGAGGATSNNAGGGPGSRDMAGAGVGGSDQQQRGRMQRRKRHTPEQIIAKLREADAMQPAGKSIAQIVQHLGVSEPTFHRWRHQFDAIKLKRPIDSRNSRTIVSRGCWQISRLIFRFSRRSPWGSSKPVWQASRDESRREQLAVSERGAWRVIEQASATRR